MPTADSPTQPFRWSAASPAQRRVVIAASLGWMLDAFDVMLYSIVLATLIRAFTMSRTTAGLLNALTLIASAIGGLLFGMLADRFGRRRMLTASILAYSVFTFACGLSTGIFTLAIFRFLLGLGMGGEWNTGAALVAESWPAAWRGRALGFVQSSWAIGYALAALVAGLILNYAGGALCVVALGFLRRHPSRVFSSSGSSTACLSRRSGNAPAPLPPLRNPTGAETTTCARSSLLTAANTCGMFAWWGLFTWIPAYLVLPAAQGGRGLHKPQPHRLSGHHQFIGNAAGLSSLRCGRRSLRPPADRSCSIYARRRAPCRCWPPRASPPLILALRVHRGILRHRLLHRLRHPRQRTLSHPRTRHRARDLLQRGPRPKRPRPAHHRRPQRAPRALLGVRRQRHRLRRSRFSRSVAARNPRRIAVASGSLESGVSDTSNA
jgi:MFS family permease